MIKNKIIAEFTHSQEKQIKKLINEPELDDKKPSQLLREMKTLAARQITDDVLKTLWLQRLANIADKLQEVHVSKAMMTSSNIAAITTKTRSRTPDNDDICSSSAEPSSECKPQLVLLP
ncbi:hypothetical protein Zmor_018492 [Zophobas morio]|uniref:Uncharacterized protein n=1 Tax=Zophobas morio TaxID=2755281 RepID=A0AA38MDJ7_9CUCU|nr:hypothetical protein Zmor_018492 [Zophobas morio]